MNTTAPIITRADYLASTTGKMDAERAALHSEYYTQFVTPGVIAAVSRAIGEKAIKASQDPHFNDIPLSKWDAMSQSYEIKLAGGKMKAHGDYLTLSGVVCIAKEAARQIKNLK